MKVDERIKISIIIPFYNVEKYIYDCASSLLLQSLRNIEYIFIDDGSKDNSVAELNRAIKEHSDVCTKIIIHSYNKGIAASRNEGIHISCGDYIGFVDADDWIDKFMFEKLYDIAIRDGADLVWCDYYIEYPMYSKREQVNFSDDNIIDFMRLYLTRSVNHLWNMLVHRNLYIMNNISFLDGNDMCEDYNVTTKLFYCSKRRRHVSESLYHYRYNMNSICNTMSRKDYIARLKNASELIEYFEDKDIYEAIKQYLYYRILLYKQFYLYKEKNITAYMQTYPESNKYILSNPFYGRKAKIIEWISVKLYTLIVKLVSLKI